MDSIRNSTLLWTRPTGPNGSTGALIMRRSRTSGQVVLFATDAEDKVTAQINLTPADLDALADAADYFREIADGLAAGIEARQGADRV